MKMKTKYKYLEFNEIKMVKERRTKVFEICNHATDCFLGYIEWDKGWRQYVWITPCSGEYKMSKGCLIDMADFIQQLMAEWLQNQKDNARTAVKIAKSVSLYENKK